LGIDKSTTNHHADFEQFCGQWTEKQKEEFDKATAMFSEIDDEIWT
jgi:hypothetical protein